MFKEERAYGVLRGMVGSEMGIRDGKGFNRQPLPEGQGRWGLARCKPFLTGGGGRATGHRWSSCAKQEPLVCNRLPVDWR